MKPAYNPLRTRYTSDLETSFDAEAFCNALKSGAFDHRIHEELRKLTQSQLAEVSRLMMKHADEAKRS